MAQRVKMGYIAGLMDGKQYLNVFLIFVLFLQSSCNLFAADESWDEVEHPGFDFSVPQNTSAWPDWQVHYASAILNPDLLPPALQKIDYLKFRNLADTKVLAFKSAFVVNVPFAFVNRSDFLTTTNFTSYFPKVRFHGGGSNRVTVELSKSPFPFVPKAVNCNLTWGHYAKSKQAEIFSHLDPQLGSPQSMSFTNCTNFDSMLNGLLVLNHFYPTKEGRTLVVNYQLVFIRDGIVKTTSFVPFFDLRDNMMGRMVYEIEVFMLTILDRATTLQK